MMALSLVALMTASGAAWAAPSAPPITVNADHSVAIQSRDASTGRVTYEGHVVITRGDVVIHGAQAVVYINHQQLEKAVVTGAPARFSWRPETGLPVHGQALKITYLAANGTVELDNEATLHRGKEVLSATHVRYNLNTRVLEAHAAEGERVHVVIPPAQSTDGAATSRS